MKDAIWNRLKLITTDEPDLMYYYPSNIKIEYNDIINIWYHFLEKEFTDNKKIFDRGDKKLISCLKISLFETGLAIILENLFLYHFACYEDDLILIYIKDEDKILLLYKSFFPLLDSEEINLPFWIYYIKSPNISNYLNKLFKNEENICIITYLL